MLGYMFWFLIHCKGAWCDSNDDLKKVAWKSWALLSIFFAQAVHTLSVSHSQFDKHLTMPQISRRHPLCVAVMHPKKNPCLLQPVAIVPLAWSAALCSSPWVLRALKHLSRTWFSIMWVIRYFSQATSEDRHIGDTTASFLIQFRGAYWRYWKNCPHLLFVSQQDA